MVGGQRYVQWMTWAVSAWWKRREMDCAVPRDQPVVAIDVRLGVGEGRAKRIKEFATELKEAKNAALSISSLFISCRSTRGAGLRR